MDDMKINSSKLALRLVLGAVGLLVALLFAYKFFIIPVSDGIAKDQGIKGGSNSVELPKPMRTGEISLEQLLTERRSIRKYTEEKLTISEIGQMLWSAQGITNRQGYRTAPSAGALYPLELYVVVGRVQGMEKGVYHYDSKQHKLIRTTDSDMRRPLAQAALSQSSVKGAAAIIVFAADYGRTTKKYGKRGIRYVHIEVGHAAQNLFLQAGALELATVVVGAFDDDRVARLLQLPVQLRPLLLMPVGRK